MKNCTDYLNVNINSSLSLKSKYTWYFNLIENQINIFQIDTILIGEIGHMLMYSFNQTNGGHISLTKGGVSDFGITSTNSTKKLNESETIGFAVNLILEAIMKNFTIWDIPVFYEYPGNYYIKIWLQNKGPFDYYRVKSITNPVVISDSKFTSFLSIYTSFFLNDFET